MSFEDQKAKKQQIINNFKNNVLNLMNGDEMG